MRSNKTERSAKTFLDVEISKYVSYILGRILHEPSNGFFPLGDSPRGNAIKIAFKAGDKADLQHKRVATCRK